AHIVMEVPEGTRALVAATKTASASTLAADQAPTANEASPARRVAFMFTGQGSHSVGMGQELYLKEPLFRETIDRCGQVLAPHLPVPLQMLLNPSDVHLPMVTAVLAQTQFAQPVIFAIEYALTAMILDQQGRRPSALLGHSLGEYVAATVAGVFCLEDGLSLVAQRAALMQASRSRRDTSSGGESKPVVAVAAANGPRSVVVSGEASAVLETMKRLGKENAFQLLPVSHAFHSPLMSDTVQRFNDIICSKLSSGLQPPAEDMQIISTVTGEVADAQLIRQPTYWAEHIIKGVHFARAVQTVVRDFACEIVMEIGPRPVLSVLGQQAAKGVKTATAPAWVAMGLAKGHDTEQADVESALLCASGGSGCRVSWCLAGTHSLRGAHPLHMAATANEASPARRVAFMFTGQGSHSVGMGQELYLKEPLFRETIDRCGQVLAPHLPVPLQMLLNPSDVHLPMVTAVLAQTQFAQPVIFAIEYALTAMILDQQGRRPSALLGHSLGEYVAATVAGVFCLEDGLSLVAQRAALMQASRSRRGVMAACRAAEKDTREAVEHVSGVISDTSSGGESKPVVAVAAVNGPRSVVVSGEASAVLETMKRLDKENAFQLLPVSHAFHSPLMSDTVQRFNDIICSKLSSGLQPPAEDMQIISTVTGEVADAQLIRQPTYWAEHIIKGVHFARAVQTVVRDFACEIVMEIGPRPVLLSCVVVPGGYTLTAGCASITYGCLVVDRVVCWSFGLSTPPHLHRIVFVTFVWTSACLRLHHAADR
ncbi:unnamed protein product, partial [Vitrella brassicaformis CCMP3155]